jgi:predicted TIM-barrel fold metal-dependent hydrolase
MGRIVDAHTHLIGAGHWPSRYYDQIAFNWAHAPRPRRDPADVRPRIEGGLIDPDGKRMVADMENAEVDIAAVLPIDWGPTFDEPEIEGRVGIEAVHEAIASVCAAHPSKLVPFAAIDPRRDNALPLLADAYERLGMRGLKMYPSMGWYPYDACAFPLYDYCQAKSLPILFHTGPGGFPLTSPRFADVKFLREVQSQFPRLMIWVGHAGGRGGWDDAISVLATGANSYLELSTCVWDDIPDEALDDFAARLGKACKQFGAHRFIFGSDHVSGQKVRGGEFLNDIVVGFVELRARARQMGQELTESDMEAIMGGNVAEQLKLA